MMRTTAQLIFGTVQTRVNHVDLENMLTFRSNETFDVDTAENGPSKTWDPPPLGSNKQLWAQYHRLAMTGLFFYTNLSGISS